MEIIISGLLFVVGFGMAVVPAIQLVERIFGKPLGQDGEFPVMRFLTGLAYMGVGLIVLRFGASNIIALVVVYGLIMAAIAFGAGRSAETPGTGKT